MNDPCPRCGYRREPLMVSLDPDAPDLADLLRGKGERIMQVIAWVGTILLSVGFLTGLLLAINH